MSTNYVTVCEEEGDDVIELPLEDDGTLLLSTVTAHYPGTTGLKFKYNSTTYRGVKLADGKFHAPNDNWGTITYYCVFLKENKRKSDDCTENLVAKTKRMDISKCTDLIVLGLPYELTDAQFRSYFESFGELLMAMIKKDTTTGRSKGFGFIRFAKYESQVRALAAKHRIHDRDLSVKIPMSQEASNGTLLSKIFVGRITEDLTLNDLREHFEQYGQVLNVFVPKPFRSFAFVTFVDASVAASLFGEDQIIKGVSVHIGEVVPKSNQNNNNNKKSNPANPENPNHSPHPADGVGYAYLPSSSSATANDYSKCRPPPAAVTNYRRAPLLSSPRSLMSIALNEPPNRREWPSDAYTSDLYHHNSLMPPTTRLTPSVQGAAVSGYPESSYQENWWGGGYQSGFRSGYNNRNPDGYGRR